MSEILGDTAAPAPQVEAPAVETQTPDAAPTPESEAQAARPKTLSPTEKRIKELTWKAHEADRRLNREYQDRTRIEQEAGELRRQLTELNRRATAPKLEQFNFDPSQFEKAYEQHYAQQREAEAKSQQEMQQRQSQAAAQHQLQSHVEARIAEGETKYPDYREVVNNPSLPPLATVNPMLFTAIITHEQMPELTYFLGKNASEAHRLAQLPPARAIMELGKIAGKLGTTPTQSKAPPPPPTVGNNAEVKKSLADMSQAEYEKARRKARGIY